MSLLFVQCCLSALIHTLPSGFFCRSFPYIVWSNTILVMCASHILVLILLFTFVSAAACFVTLDVHPLLSTPPHFIPWHALLLITLSCWHAFSYCVPWFLMLMLFYHSACCVISLWCCLIILRALSSHADEVLSISMSWFIILDFLNYCDSTCPIPFHNSTHYIYGWSCWWYIVMSHLANHANDSSFHISCWFQNNFAYLSL